ncbi:MAG TPA: tyrosine-protein phosphatase [Acidimicrobiia bacterium]|nr:tyrosine-protein phosphatase [Acidimicrobiia bacterium]
MTAPVIPLTGAANFRDLGGHSTPDGTVRTGRVFRSDSLAYLDRDEAERLVAELGVEVVLDLRSDQEVGELPLTTLEAAGMTVRRIPLLDGLHASDEDFEWESLTLVGLYQLMLDRCADGFVAATRLVADATHHPLVFQCAAGKDRTGVLAALVLGTLGVDDETIALDYARTAAAIEVIRRRLAARPATREVPEQFLAVEAATMRQLLQGLREEYGSVPGYLHARGLEPEAADALRAALVTRSG